MPRAEKVVIKRRHPLFVVLLSFLTVGIYYIYWFYSTSKELIRYTKKDSSPILWTIGLFIPIVNLVVLWKYAHALQEATKGEMSGLLVFVLWLVFAPAAWYVVQSELNKLAK